MDTASTIIEVRDLGYSFKERLVLKGISFSIRRGETWSVIGKNGAGKSTLIRCIAGLLNTSAGSVLIHGRDVAALKPRDRAKVLSYVPQAAARNLAPYSVLEFVMLGRFPYQGIMTIPSPEDRRIVREALALADIDAFRERLVTTLSGGELQRVFLAAAVAQQSNILLLDEPATFLDPLHQHLMTKTLQRIHEELGTIIITITHDVNAAIASFSNVLALVDGSLFFAGPVSDFRERCPGILNKIYSIPFEEARCACTNRLIVVSGENE